MKSVKLFCPIFLSTLVLICPHVQTQEDGLSAVECEAKLPSKRSSVSSIYDGDDTIYLFGGLDDRGTLDEALKYSISQDTIIPAGLLPTRGYGGGVILDNQNQIYHVGGSATEEIYRYDPQAETFISVGQLPARNYLFASISRPDVNAALFFGGKGDPSGVTRLNMDTLDSERIADLPKSRMTGNSISAIWVESLGSAYIFDGELGLENVVIFDWARESFQLLPNYFPHLWGASQAVWDGRYGYIIGGFGDSDQIVPSDSIIQFDPETGDIEFLPVLGYPGWTDSPFSETSAVYVEKLNRIYMFGGFTRNASIFNRDEIWYISLDPLSPPTTTGMPSTANTPLPTLDPEVFNCVGRPDVAFPYPGDCTRFIHCLDYHAYVFSCPEPLHFDPVNRQCTFADYAQCE